MSGLPLFIWLRHSFLTGWTKWYVTCDRCDPDDSRSFHCKGHYLKSLASECAHQHHLYEHYGVLV